VQDALEVRVAHADVVHVVERIADVIDARAANADALRDEPRAAVQIELAHVRRMPRVGDECERAHGSPANLYWDEARLVYPPRHLAVPKARERAPQTRSVDAVGNTPARAAEA
jgi:hypothetical protein